MDESEPLLPTTPPPSYYNAFSSLNTGEDIPPPTYQQSIRPKNPYLGPPPLNGPNDYKTLAAVTYFCCLIFPCSWMALYYSARVQEYTDNGDITAAKRASRRTCYWSACTLIIGWSLLVILVAIATFIVTCYKLHQTCGVLYMNNFTHTKL